MEHRTCDCVFGTFFSIRTETVDCLFGNSIPVGDIWGEKLDRLTKITMNRWTLVYYLFLVSHFFSKLPVFSSCYSSNRRGGNAWRIFNYPSQKLLPCGGNRCSVNSIFIFHVLWKIGKTKILLRTEAYDLFKIKWGKRRWNSEPEVNLVV